MADTIKVDIVSVEREIFSGEAQMVFAPAVMGEVGIAPGHAPFLTRLGPGELRIKDVDGKEQAFFITGGLLEVQPTLVTILSDLAERAEDLDEAAVLRAKEEATRQFHEREAKIDYATAQAQLAETAAQLQTIQRLRRRSGRG
jgi:F-type H+-transporting ATPase subunit epsilon